MSQRTESTYAHLIGGGLGGTLGSVVTCPLEVVKTRLQSSSCSLSFSTASAATNGNCAAHSKGMLPTLSSSLKIQAVPSRSRNSSYNLLHCLRHIVSTEGPGALMKGLGPTIIGVAPARAVYFGAYAESKRYFNGVFTPDTSIVHIFSAACAGFSATTLTNPVWYVRTRLQLDRERRGSSLTATQCIKETYRDYGFRGFFRGVTASYYGISETILYFVIYEAIKSKVFGFSPNEERKLTDTWQFMAASGTSKTIASCVAYPHEVVRTRLRETGTKYRSFWQTLFLVCKEEGYRGIYRGLFAQLVRQIPNSAVMMSTYEAFIMIHKRYS